MPRPVITILPGRVRGGPSLSRGRPPAWLAAAFLPFLLGSPVHAAGNLADEFLKVSSVRFEGNETFEDDDLRAWVRLQTPSLFHPFRRSYYRRDFVRADVEALKAFYRRSGFLHASVDDRTTVNPATRRVDVTFSISEGERTWLKGVRYEGVAELDPVELRKGSFLARGGAFNTFAVASERERLLLAYSDQGYYPQISDTAEVEGDSATVIYQLEEGPQIHVGEVRFEGLERNRPVVVEREMSTRVGTLLRRRALESDKAHLYDTQLFNEVSIVPLEVDSVSHSAHLVVRLVERKPGWLSGGVGLGSQDGIRLVAETGSRSLFHRGRRLTLQTALSYGRKDYIQDTALVLQSGQIGLALSEPWFLGTRTRASLGLNFSTIADTSLPHYVRTISLTLQRRISETTHLNSSLVHQGISPHAGAGYTSNLLNLGFDRDRRDFPFDPTSGSFQEVNVRFAGGVLGGSGSSFHKEAGTASWYRLLSRRTVLATRIRAGAAFPFRDPQAGFTSLQLLRPEERFKTGGATTVRGYAEDEIGGVTESQHAGLGSSDAGLGGRLLLVANVELRFPLAWILSGALFLDGGNVWSNPADFQLKALWPNSYQGTESLKSMRYSMGGGLRLATPVGPFRVDYGVRMNRPDIPQLRENRPRGGFEFSLGQAF